MKKLNHFDKLIGRYWRPIERTHFYGSIDRVTTHKGGWSEIHEFLCHGDDVITPHKKTANTEISILFYLAPINMSIGGIQ